MPDTLAEGTVTLGSLSIHEKLLIFSFSKIFLRGIESNVKANVEMNLKETPIAHVEDRYCVASVREL